MGCRSKKLKDNKRQSKEKYQTILHVSCCTFVLLRNWEKNLQGVKSWARLPKFCGTCGVLCEGSSASFTIQKVPQNLPAEPKGSAEFWEGGGVWEPQAVFSGLAFLPPSNKVHKHDPTIGREKGT